MACWRGVCSFFRGSGHLEDLAGFRANFDGCSRPGSPESLATTWSASEDASTAFPKDTPETGFDGWPVDPTSEAPKGNILRVSNPGKVQAAYTFENQNLGMGAFSTVCKATSKATAVNMVGGDNQRPTAVKMVNKNDIKAVDDFERFRREIELTGEMDHPNIVKLVETFEDATTVYLIMELCSGGELLDRIVEAGSISEKQVAGLMEQMCCALCYMHGEGICHRDLKPEHFIFVTAGPVEGTPLKLIDFGLSRRFLPGEVLTTCVGTPNYVAPEVIKKNYGPECDMWSCGCIMYCLLSGRLPFVGTSPKEVLKNARKGRYTLEGIAWDSVSQDAKELIRKLLERNPKGRWTASQVMKHVWIQGRAPNVAGRVLADVVENLKILCLEFRKARRVLQAVKDAKSEPRQ